MDWKKFLIPDKRKLGLTFVLSYFFYFVAPTFSYICRPAGGGNFGCQVSFIKLWVNFSSSIIILYLFSCLFFYLLNRYCKYSEKKAVKGRLNSIVNIITKIIMVILAVYIAAFYLKGAYLGSFFLILTAIILWLLLKIREINKLTKVLFYILLLISLLNVGYLILFVWPYSCHEGWGVYHCHWFEPWHIH